MKSIQLTALKTFFSEEPSRTQKLLPRLIKELVKASYQSQPEQVQECYFPSGESINLPGFDGRVRVENAYRQYVPQGYSLWEIGTKKDFKKKITDDFKKRLSEADAGTVFVALTSQTWSKNDRDAWVNKHSGSGWKNIHVLDLEDIVQWLQDQPSVTWWFGNTYLNWPVEEPNKLRVLGALCLTSVLDTSLDTEKVLFEKIAGVPHDNCASYLNNFKKHGVVTFSNNFFRIVDPVLTWAYLEENLDHAFLTRFFEAVSSVFKTPEEHTYWHDEAFPMPIREIRSTVFSNTLRRGICIGLAVVACSNAPDLSIYMSQNPDRRVAQILMPYIKEVFETDQLLLELDSGIVYLTEACPDIVLNNIERYIERTSENKIDSGILSVIFSSLNVLIWHPNYFRRCADCIFKLRSQTHWASNYKPLQIFYTWFNPYFVNSSVLLKDKVALVNNYLDQDINFCTDLVLKFFEKCQSCMCNSRPEFRNWPDTPKYYSSVDSEDYKHRLALMLAEKITKNIDTINIEHISAFFDAVASSWCYFSSMDTNELIISLKTMSSDKKIVLWEKLTFEIVPNNKRFGQSWGVDPEALATLNQMVKALKPENILDRYAPYFTKSNIGSILWPELGYNEAFEKANIFCSKKMKALFTLVRTGEILQQNFIDWLLSASTKLKPQNHFSIALISHLKPNDPLWESILSNFSFTPHTHYLFMNFSIALAKYNKKNPLTVLYIPYYQCLTLHTKAMVLAGCQFTNSLLKALVNENEETQAEYWKQFPIWLESDLKHHKLIFEKLMSAKRFMDLLEMVTLNRITFLNSIDDYLKVLEGVAQSAETSINVQNSYYIEKAFEHLEKDYIAKELAEPQVEQLFKLEWMYCKLFDNFPITPSCLYQAIAAQPNIFVELVKFVFNEDNTERDPDRILSPVEKINHGNAFHLLYFTNWDSYFAGESAEGWDAAQLIEWVENVKLEAKNVNRENITMGCLDEVLSKSKRRGTDGHWPHEAIRQVIENEKNDKFSRHFMNGYFNHRTGMALMGQGGLEGQEMDLDILIKTEDALALHQPRTVQLLRHLINDKEDHMQRLKSLPDRF
jgi:hypothetical protein